MATKPNLPPENEDPEKQGANPGEDPIGTTISAPALSPDGKSLNIKARSVKSVEHAYNICTGLEQANAKVRSPRSAVIQAVYDGRPPNDPGDKQQKAKSWQSNTSTRWLAGLVDPLTMRMKKAVKSGTFLTYSELSHNFQGFNEKSSYFRSRTTGLIKSWEGFECFTENIAKETCLHGYSYAAFTSKSEWRPTFYKQELAFVPDKTPNNPKGLQVFCVRHDYQLHEFIELFADEEAASMNGYDIPNCLKAANESTAEVMGEDTNTTQFRNFADMLAEGTLGIGMTNSGSRIVRTYLLWTREYDGSVSFWIIRRDYKKDDKLLRFVERMYPRFEDVVSMFAFDTGNGTLHSSQGIGRKTIGQAITIEKVRNGAVDASLLANLLMLKVDAKDRAKMQPLITQPFCVLPKEVDVEQMRFQNNADEVLKIDQANSRWAQQNVGAYIQGSGATDGSPDKTATEASIDAQRDAEFGNLVLDRFLSYFYLLVSSIQRRIYSDENIETAKRIFVVVAQGIPPEAEEAIYDAIPDEQERDAVRCIVDLMKFDLTETEIRFLRNRPASPNVQSDSVLKSSGVAKIAAAYTGNPNIDQMALLKDTIEEIGGPEAAKRYVIPGLDQTVIAEAARMQMMEAATMMAMGMEIPVSPRDSHLVHAKALVDILKAQVQVLSSDPKLPQSYMKAVAAMLNHYASHLEGIKDSGEKVPELHELDAFYKQFKTDFEKVIGIQQELAVHTKAMNDAAAIVASGAAPAPGAAPQPVPSSPQVKALAEPAAPPTETPVV